MLEPGTFLIGGLEYRYRYSTEDTCKSINDYNPQARSIIRQVISLYLYSTSPSPAGVNKSEGSDPMLRVAGCNVMVGVGMKNV